MRSILLVKMNQSNNLSYSVYLIISVDSNSNSNISRSYIGCTNNFPVRLSRHNGFLSGGAKYTAGRIWVPMIVISGFNKIQALSFEKGWKIASKGRACVSKGKATNILPPNLHRRIVGLQKMINESVICDNKFTRRKGANNNNSGPSITTLDLTINNYSLFDLFQ